MASILLSHVASDSAEVKQLLAALQAAGHKVVGADPDGPHLQNSDVVVVIWSPAALASPDIYEQARVALSSHSLVQVTTDDLDVTQLSAVFRVHALTPISAVRAILGEVNRVIRSKSPRLSGGTGIAAYSIGRLPPAEKTEGEQEPSPVPKKLRPLKIEPNPIRGHVSSGATLPAAQEPPPAPFEDARFALGADDATLAPQIPAHLWRAALEKEAGQLNHKIPSNMRVGATEVVEVRLGRAHQDIAIGLMGSGDLTAEELPIIETMTVDLYGSPDAFRIVRQSRPTQLVKSSLIWNTPFDDQRFGRWLWHVTPKKSGTHELVVKVSADMSDSRGVATSEPYGDRTFSVRVRVNLGQASVRVLKWTTAGAVSGLAGAYTHEVWWPKLRALLAGAGLLS